MYCLNSAAASPKRAHDRGIAGSRNSQGGMSIKSMALSKTPFVMHLGKNLLRQLLLNQSCETHTTGKIQSLRAH